MRTVSSLGELWIARVHCKRSPHGTPRRVRKVGQRCAEKREDHEEKRGLLG